MGQNYRHDSDWDCTTGHGLRRAKLTNAIYSTAPIAQAFLDDTARSINVAGPLFANANNPDIRNSVPVCVSQYLGPEDNFVE